jgi:hypothetical protein
MALHINLILYPGRPSNFLARFLVAPGLDSYLISKRDRTSFLIFLQILLKDPWLQKRKPCRATES